MKIYYWSAAGTLKKYELAHSRLSLNGHRDGHLCKTGTWRWSLSLLIPFI